MWSRHSVGSFARRQRATLAAGLWDLPLWVNIKRHSGTSSCSFWAAAHQWLTAFISYFFQIFDSQNVGFGRPCVATADGNQWWFSDHPSWSWCDHGQTWGQHQHALCGMWSLHFMTSVTKLKRGQWALMLWHVLPKSSKCWSILNSGGQFLWVLQVDESPSADLRLWVEASNWEHHHARVPWQF